MFPKTDRQTDRNGMILLKMVHLVWAGANSC